jgi:VWFA-related protein
MFLATAGAGLVSSRFSRAQEPAAGGDAKFSTDVKVVNVLASVRDKQGRIVSDLTKDDFDLQDEGRHQTITYFSRETEMPLTLGLLVDTSGSQRRVIGEETDASRRFVEKVVREDRDQTFLIHFDRDTELLQDLTNSRSKLERALDQVGLDDSRQGGYGGGGGYPGNGGGSRRGGGGAGGGTTLYDAVYLASNELMKKRMGRKAVILLTDGVDHGSKESLPQAIESAQRSDTLVYSILFTGQEQQQQPFGGGGFGGRGMSRRGGGFPQQTYERTDGKRVLQQMSRETGGGFYEVSKNMSIDQIYARIEEELRNQYSLGYSPDNPGGYNFRRITVAVKRSNMVVQARQGYYPAS